MQYTIQFDGGTSCNIPRLGFGNGYGSYKINDEPIHRCNFNQPMSANAAELSTLLYAIRAIRGRDVLVDGTDLFIVGDSQIVLNRVANFTAGIGFKTRKKTTPEFRETLRLLYHTLMGFRSVKVKWQPRFESVATLGH